MGSWYEIQDLRSLRSDRFTTHDIDLDATVAALGLSYAKEFRIRFCQYDNNPAPMDGIFVRRIELTGELRPPVLHLTMDDNAANPTVADASEGQYDQTFVDPGGDPNTEAHSTAGTVGTALAFDGVDDYLQFTPASHKPYLAENHDFSILFWWKADGPNPGGARHVVGNYSLEANEESCFFYYTLNDAFRIRIDEYEAGDVRYVYATFPGGTDGTWHHYALVRQGETLRMYQDGALTSTDTDARNTVGLAPDSQNITLAKVAASNTCRAGHFDDLRIHDRAVSAEEVAALATPE